MPIAAVLSILEAVAQLLPEVSSVLPTLTKLVNGETVSEADAATVYAAVQALEAQVAAREDSITGAPAAG